MSCGQFLYLVYFNRIYQYNTIGRLNISEVGNNIKNLFYVWPIVKGAYWIS